jgi:hypothetical protein
MKKKIVEKLELETAIERWKELKIIYGKFTFDCGGDSMNETELNFYGEKNVQIKNAELEEFIYEEIYKRVDFYVNSDGHYIGENGEVHIQLTDGEDEFHFDKSSVSEWEESYSAELHIDFTQEERDFLFAKVMEMEFSGEDADDAFNGVDIQYKADTILSNKEVELEEALIQKITERAEGYDDWDGTLGECMGDTFRWSLNSNGDKIVVSVSRTFLIEKDGID